MILAFLRTVHDTPPEGRMAFDGFGALLSVAGLAMTVFGVLRSGTLGLGPAQARRPDHCGVSLVFWLVLGGLLVLGAPDRVGGPP